MDGASETNSPPSSPELFQPEDTPPSTTSGSPWVDKFMSNTGSPLKMNTEKPIDNQSTNQDQDDHDRDNSHEAEHASHNNLQEALTAASAGLLPQLVVNTAYAHNLKTQLNAVAEASTKLRPAKKTIKHLKKRVLQMNEKISSGISTYASVQNQLSEISSKIPDPDVLNQQIEALDNKLATLKNQVDTLFQQVPPMGQTSHSDRARNSPPHIAGMDGPSTSAAARDRAHKKGAGSLNNPTGSSPSGPLQHPSKGIFQDSSSATSSVPTKGSRKVYSTPETNQPSPKKRRVVQKRLNTTKSCQRPQRTQPVTKPIRNDSGDSLEDFDLRKGRARATKAAPRTRAHTELLQTIRGRKGDVVGVAPSASDVD